MSALARREILLAILFHLDGETGRRMIYIRHPVREKLD